MQQATYTLSIPGLDLALRVARFEGSEEISGLYRYDVTLSHADPNLSFDDVVGQPAVLTMRLGPEPRHVHGIILAFEQDELGKRQSFYRATLVPELWTADQKQDIRIFQDLDVVGIIDKVLADAELAVSGHRFSLVESYAKREYCVQYRESDWDFISRLMEDEGIHCFFEHAADKHTLVIADSPAAHAELAGESTMRFRPTTGALYQAEAVSVFRYRQAILPDRVTLQDYDFKRPRLDLEAEADGAEGTPIEVYDYPGGYVEPDVGSTLAKVRLELWQVARKTAQGRSSCARFTPGHTFSLSEHPRDAFNRGYLILRVEHFGEDPPGDARETYANSFQCIPDDAPYRTPLRTLKPTVKGVQTAIVTGPAGDEIYTDEHGRVKVQFHWDREGKNDEASSCWIRVSQPWAGPGWGAMFIPRIGQEVVVDFLDGDPDRPIIVGRVYHGTNVPPYVLPDFKTCSTIKSNSSPGGEGFNELRFEDLKDKEEIYLHGQKDWTIAIENDKNQTVGRDETLEVGNDRSKVIGHDQSAKIGRDKSIAVGGEHTEKIGGNESIEIGESETLKVGKDRQKKVGANQTVKIGKDNKIEVGGDHTEGITGAMKLTVGKDRAIAVDGKGTTAIKEDNTLQVDGAYNVEVGKSMACSVKEDQQTEIGKEQSITVGDKMTLEVGDGKVTVEKDGTITVEGKDITVKGGGTINVEGDKVQIKSKGAVDVKADGDVKLKGSGVGLN